MLETIFLWGIYIVLPTILFYRFLGAEKTGLILVAIVGLHQTNIYYDANQITFPVEGKTDSVIILASSEGNRGQSFVPPNVDHGRRYLTDPGAGAGAGAVGSNSGGSGGESGSGSGSLGSQPELDVKQVDVNAAGALPEEVLEKNHIPPQENWKSDLEEWEKDEEDWETLGDTCDEEPGSTTNLLGVQVDFPHKKNSNGKPDLLVSFFDKAFGKERTSEIPFDQTATHLHHSSEIGVPMPPFFEQKKTKAAYIGMTKAERLEYARKNIPDEYIIAYQNAIGHCMKGEFGITTRNFRGIAGKYKVPVTVIVQTFPGGKGGPAGKGQRVKVSVIRDDGRHAATETMTGKKFQRIMSDPNGFWLYPTRPF